MQNINKIRYKAKQVVSETTIQKHKINVLPFVCLAVSVIVWGMSFISTKVVLKTLPPSSIAFLRQIIALVPLSAALILSKSNKLPDFKDVIKIAFSGFFGIVLYFVFENNGLLHTSASSASMIVSTVPVFTLLAELVFLKKRANKKIWIAVAASITGVYFVISENGRIDLFSTSVYGNFLVLAAMICWVAYTVISRNLSKKYSSLVITTYQTGCSILLFLPFIINELPNWRKPNILTISNLLFLGICCSALAYVCFLYAVSRVGASTSSAYLNMVPVVSVVSAYFILGEKLTVFQSLGMAIILISLFSITYQQTTISQANQESSAQTYHEASNP